LLCYFNPEVPAQESPAQKRNISDEELKVFAKAYVQVDKIRLAYEPSLRNAQSPEQAQNIQREATGKMEKAVEEQGLTRESYVSILTTVNGDADLRGKTIKLIEEEKKKP
jgi:Domain of unknown function (DUF4168)